MIDHVSIGVRNLEKSTELYQAILSLLGFKKLSSSDTSVGFGKKYPEFWLNLRTNKNIDDNDNGCHICLRAKSIDIVNQFYRDALELGAVSEGEPGYRPEYNEMYYAAFFRDQDQNHIELVTFVSDSSNES